MTEELKADVVVVGGGLAGLVAAAELADAGKSVLLLDQEPEASLGGQAFWSLGGLFLVDSPEQRRARIKDSFELAWSDWLGSAAFDRPEDEWPRKVAKAYVEFAAGEKRAWLLEQGIKSMPSPGWAERGGGLAIGHGNSVPRFHLTWGTGPAVVAPFETRVRAGVERGNVQLAFRHQVDSLVIEGGAAVAVTGSLLEPSSTGRGVDSSREVVGDFIARGQAIVLTTGGIGHNFDLVRKYWPTERLGPAPKNMISGVPKHVDGRMLEIAESAGAGWIGRDRMWHYVEGIRNWDPIWSDHGIRILPAPSSMWFDATGKRLPPPLLPGFDTMGTLAYIGKSGYDYTWFCSEPDITGKDLKFTVRTRLLPGVPGPIQRFMDHGADFVVAKTIAELVAGMNRVAEQPLIDEVELERQIHARDLQVDNAYGKDFQVMAIRAARKYLPDRLQRVVAPHKILDPEAGPLIAVKLNILTRKTLGGIHTDTDARVLDGTGAPIGGLYAAGEVAGFGGGGMMGYNALEGTFLGGCLFSGRTAGRAIIAAL